MIDADIIQWLKHRSRQMADEGTPSTYYGLAAERLERLLYHDDPKRPVSHEREADIRAGDRRFSKVNLGREHSVLGHRRDLLVLLDYERSMRHLAEAALQDCLAETDHFDRGVAAGLAAAVQEAQKHSAYTSTKIMDRCGPGTRLPHLEAMARLARLEEVLRQLAMDPSLPLGVRDLARKALEG